MSNIKDATSPKEFMRFANGLISRHSNVYVKKQTQAYKERNDFLYSFIWIIKCLHSWSSDFTVRSVNYHFLAETPFNDHSLFKRMLIRFIKNAISKGWIRISHCGENKNTDLQRYHFTDEFLCYLYSEIFIHFSYQLPFGNSGNKEFVLFGGLSKEIPVHIASVMEILAHRGYRSQYKYFMNWNGFEITISNGSPKFIYIDPTSVSQEQIVKLLYAASKKKSIILCSTETDTEVMVSMIEC